MPFPGEDALVHKHDVSQRSQRQQGILAFLAHDAEARVFCSANGPLRKEEHHEEMLQFVASWEQRTGPVPQALLFASTRTTSTNLNRLNQRHIQCITVRRRSHKRRATRAHLPASAWRRVERKNVARASRRPRVLDEHVPLGGDLGSLRQLPVADLGHEAPTVLRTTQRQCAPATLIERDAQRLVIDNSIADGLDFFPMDALSSAVAMQITCDVQLTLMASSRYRLLGTQVGRGDAAAKGRHIVCDVIDAVGLITRTADEIIVRYQKRAHNPLLIAAGFANTNVPVPWLGGKRLRLVFG